jgi:hypothetical protein
VVGAFSPPHPAVIQPISVARDVPATRRVSPMVQ